MADKLSGKILKTSATHVGKLTSNNSTQAGKINPGSGFTDHTRLLNRDAENQHPISAIEGLRSELDSKLNSTTAMPLIEEALKGKAKGLYFDAMKEFARKSYWYLTSEIDPNTKMGTKESIISGPYDLGMGGGSGGGGGGGGVTSVTISPYEWPTSVTVGGQTELKVKWSSTIGEDKAPTGNGTLYLTINNKQVEVKANCAQGIVPFNVSKYLVAGNNTIQVKVLDMYGTTGITISTINAVTLRLESKFDGEKPYQGEINYTYIPIGDVEKDIYFYIDGKLHGQQTVLATNETQTYTIKGLSHGAHSLEVYFDAWVDSGKVSSNHLYYELIYFEPGNTTPIIASTFRDLEQEQYISFNIPYRVYIYGRNSFPVTLSVNGEVIKSLTVNSATQYWSYRNDTPGNYTLTIACGTAKKTFEVHIVESTIQVFPVESGLALALNAQGRTNSDGNRTDWSFTDAQGTNYACELNDFNWSSDGWLLDSDGNNVLRVSGDARVKIPFQIFANDFKSNGKTIELEIATRSVRDYDTPIISCLDAQESPFFEVEESIKDADKRIKGFKVNYTYSTLEDLARSGKLPVGEHIFNYNGTGWLLDNKTVNLSDYGLHIQEQKLNVEGEETPITIAGDQIIINYSLEARGIKVTPQVASIRSQQSMLSTQYKEDEHVRISFVVEQAAEDRIIWMYLNGIASGAMQYPVDDTFKQLSATDISIGSNEAIIDIYNIRVYNNSLTQRQIVTNWIADTQDAGLRAERWEHNDVLDDTNSIIVSKVPEDLPYMIWDIDPLPQAKGDKRPGNVYYFDASHPERNFTAENAEYNVQGTSSSVYPVKNIRIKYKANSKYPTFAWYDDNGDTIKEFPITYPGGIGDNYFTYKVDYASSEGANNVELVRLYNDAALKYGIYTPPQRRDSKVRVGIDGFPIIAFHQDADGNVKFHTKANFNNDKANEDVYGFAKGDESWEITNNSAAETKFQVPITTENFERGFEIRFPDEDGYSDMSKLEPMSRWLVSTYRDLATNEDIPEVTFTYDETAKAEDGSFSKTSVSKTFNKDTAEYRLTKFKAELKDWFNVDSSLFYYLFTTLFLMIDSRAKNAFPTYFASREAGDGGDHWFWLPYDMDTAIGIDNKGKLTFDYYLEDTDQLKNADVYNGQDSVMWSNIRDAFPGELAEMYATLRSQGLIDYDYVEQMFEEHQSKWPETVFNIDAYNKYVIPLKAGDNYLEMLQGSKAEQRKWWLYNRFKYIDSKYNAGDAKADFVQFRAYVGKGEAKPNITVIPYANIYATVSYGNGARNTVVKRCLNRNQPVTLENTFGIDDEETDQETYIYSASQLKSIGDISPFKPDTVKVGNAIRLQELKVGDGADTYTNPHLTELTLGANTLLRKIDARNCTNLGTGNTVSPDLSKCTNIEEIYFEGTKIKGIGLPDGGTIKKLHLPGTLISLTIKNQPLLTDLVIADTNTTITRMLTSPDDYNFTGIVAQKDLWSDASANADIYLADSVDATDKIRVNIANKDLYDSLIVGTSLLAVNCEAINVRFDLVDQVDVQLIEYASSFINAAELVENVTTNIASFIAELVPQISEPTVNDFRTSLLETLWLEGIPSQSIKARELVERMKPGTEVRLIGIDETFETWEEIEAFYAILDQHPGINFSDEEVAPKAQVTGTITLAPGGVFENSSISYAKYTEYKTRYPEVEINVAAIVCTIDWINTPQVDPSLYHTQVANQGTYITLPNTPTKENSVNGQYSYTFKQWVTEDGTIWDCTQPVTRDITLTAIYDAHVRQYTITYNADSNIIVMNKTSEIAYWGDTVLEPVCDETAIPEGVTLEGWFDEEGEPWFFTSRPVHRDTLLTARWVDANKPTLLVERINHNTFKYDAKDNLGISGWALVHNSEDVPTEWHSVDPVVHYQGECQVDDSGTYSFWVTDKNGNTAFKSIISRPITQSTTPGIKTIKLTEGDSELANFALSGTTAKVEVEVDHHYENLTIQINDMVFGNGNMQIIEGPIHIDATCTPRNFPVEFITGKEGEGATVDSQSITFLHPVVKPLPLYHVGYIINNWYLDEDLTQLWNFEAIGDSDADVVNASNLKDDKLTLYAEWQEYRTPTRIKVKIPFDINAMEDKPDDDKLSDVDPYTLTVHFTQQRKNDVKVRFGDDSGEFSSPNTGAVFAAIQHTYPKLSEPKEYVIEIYGTPYGYTLGQSFTKQAVDPCCSVQDIEFAWDITTTREYAFRGAQISELRITPYMKEIATAAFAVCKNLTTLNIPSNIYKLGSQAFEHCSGLVGDIIVPKTITEVGSNVFSSCSNIDRIVFEENGALRRISAQFANTSGIRELVIPDYIETVGTEAFGNCSRLEKVVILNPNLKTDSRIFNSTFRLNTAGPIDWTKGPGKSDEFDIEYAWTTKIPSGAFEAGDSFMQSYLKHITFPDTLEEIEDKAFRGACLENQGKLVFPASLKKIGAEAFYYTELTDVEIGRLVEVGPRAFGRNMFLKTAILHMDQTQPIAAVGTAYDQGWFYECTTPAAHNPSEFALHIQIPLELFQNPTKLQSQYGDYWNLVEYKDDKYYYIYTYSAIQPQEA